MKKKLPSVAEKSSVLKEQLKAEKNKRKYQRLQMLYLIKSGLVKLKKEIAQVLSVHRNTIGRWLSLYESAGIDRLLTIEYKPNRKYSIPEEILVQLKKKLEHPEGFRSYKDIQLWLKNEYQLSLKYATVYKIVRYDLKAKLKVPRKSHVKKDQQQSDAFKDNIEGELKSISKPANLNSVRVFAADESRFGLLPISGRRITLKGVKPYAKVDLSYQNYYLYGAIEPKTGENFFLELPTLDSQCFEIFLSELSAAYPQDFNLLLLDRGQFHRTEQLERPENIGFIFFPPYCPELNPIERVWEDIKGKITLELFPTLSQLKDRVAQLLREYSNKAIKSLTDYPYLMEAINAQS